MQSKKELYSFWFILIVVLTNDMLLGLIQTRKQWRPQGGFIQKTYVIDIEIFKVVFYVYWIMSKDACAVETRDEGRTQLWISMGMQDDQEYRKSIMTSHEIIDRYKAAKMLNILFICKITIVSGF